MATRVPLRTVYCSASYVRDNLEGKESGQVARNILWLYNSSIGHWKSC